MTVFFDRRRSAYSELSGDINEHIITGISGQNNSSTHGFSGGQLPPMSNTREQYPLDQTASVVDMR